jgi:N-acetylglucosaminyldiphosphoundecaprenol N-acetyl-beta-D-mannosaminyltransferase
MSQVATGQWSPDTPRRRVRIGTVEIDHVTLAEAIDSIESLVDAGEGGSVFTPNVDHLVLAEVNPRLREAYARTSLSLVDGMPVLWASRLLGDPLPERVSGSDLVLPLMQRAGARGLKVYLLGGQPGAAVEAAEILKVQYGVRVVGTEDGMILPDQPEAPEQKAVLERIRAAHPDLLLVGLGTPKQEIWIAQNARHFGSAVAIVVGASLDFIAGKVPRAPRWMSRAGLEWSYRLAREPRRLWRRYLVRDPKFLFILAREWRTRRKQSR